MPKELTPETLRQYAIIGARLELARILEAFPELRARAAGANGDRADPVLAGYLHKRRIAEASATAERVRDAFRRAAKGETPKQIAEAPRKRAPISEETRRKMSRAAKRRHKAAAAAKGGAR